MKDTYYTKFDKCVYIQVSPCSYKIIWNKSLHIFHTGFHTGFFVGPREDYK